MLEISSISKQNASDYCKAALGDKNTYYYLKCFKRFDEKGVGATWNWSSFFVTFYWLLYRKMWLAALVFFLPIPLAIIEVILMPVSEGAANIVTIGYLVDGKSLFYIPSLENERDVAWQCRSVDIDPGLLLVNCRD